MSNGRWGSGRRGRRSNHRQNPSKVNDGDGEHGRSWISSNRRRNRPLDDNNHGGSVVVPTTASESTRTITKTMTSTSSSMTASMHHHHDENLHRSHQHHLSWSAGGINHISSTEESEERARSVCGGGTARSTSCQTSMTESSRGGSLTFHRASCGTALIGGGRDGLLHRPSPSSVRTAMLDSPDCTEGLNSSMPSNCLDEPHSGSRGNNHYGVDIGEVDAPEFAYRDHRHRGVDVGVVDVDHESDELASFDCGSSSFSDIDDDSSTDDGERDDNPRGTTANELLALVTDRRWDMAVRRAASHPEEIMARGHVRIKGDCGGQVQRPRPRSDDVPTLPLHAACTLDPPLSVVRALLAADDDSAGDGRGGPASAVDRDGRTALHWACDAGGCSPEVVRELLDANPRAAKVQERTYGFLPLHIACFRDGEEDEDEDHGIDPGNVRDGDGDDDEVDGDSGRGIGVEEPARLQRSFSSSRRRAATEVVEALLDVHPEGAAVADDVMGWTPLHVVCRTDVRGADVARSLLKIHPKAALVRDRGSRLPLHWACCHRFDRYRRRRRRRYDAVATKGTDARGSEVEAFDDCSDGTKVGSAHGEDDIDEEHDPVSELVRAVLEICPESSHKREKNYGFLPLHIACSSGASNQVISTLLSKNPDAARIKDRNESLPLHLACRADASESVLSNLLRAFPDGAHFQDADSRLPLHWACQVAGTSSSKIEALLDVFGEGAQLTEAKYGYLPLHVACKRGAGPDVVAALLAAFPEASRTRDDCGNLPIHIACGALAEQGGGAGVGEGVVGMLLLAFPESLEREDQQGRTPRMLAMDTFNEDHHGDYSDVEDDEEEGLGGDGRRPTLGRGHSDGSRDSIIRMLSSEPSRWRRDLCSSSSLTSLVEAAAASDKEEDPTAAPFDDGGGRPPLGFFLDGLLSSSSSIGAEKSSRLEHDLLEALRRHEDDMRNNLLCSSTTVDTLDEHDEHDEDGDYHERGYEYHRNLGGRRHDENHHHHHSLLHLPSSWSGDGELKYLDVLESSSWGGSPSPPPAVPLVLPPRDYSGEAVVGDHEEDHAGVAGWENNDDDDNKGHYHHHHQIVVEVDDFYQGNAAESEEGIVDDDGAVVAEQEQDERPVMCVLCLERPVSYILYPCGHPCLCETCARVHLSSLGNVCPVGRCDFRDAVRVYGRIVGGQ